MAVAEGRLREWTPTEVRVMHAVCTCVERWGLDKVTVDDIARESGISRATLYRVFPGGRDVILEAHRVYEIDEFFGVLLERVDGAADLEELLVRVVTCATQELRNDEHLARLLASEPGTVVSELSVDGLPRIIRMATAYLVPFVDEFLPRAESRALIDLVARLVISYFLSPSDTIDLADETSARTFLVPFLASRPVAPAAVHTAAHATTPTTAPTTAPTITPITRPPTPDTPPSRGDRS